MSHIPAAAMPHAQAHHTEPTPAPAAKSGTSWLTLAIGGTVAIGGALTAAWLLRGGRKPRRKTKGGGTPRKRKAKGGATRADRRADD